jgi:hypothetical protein
MVLGFGRLGDIVRWAFIEGRNADVKVWWRRT